MLSDDLSEVAQQYATAIFDVSLEKNTIDQWRSDLFFFVTVSSNSLIQSLIHQCLELEILLNLLIVIYQDFRKKKMDFYIKNFISSLLENNRFLLFPIILKEFDVLNNLHKSILEVKVISAYFLNEIHMIKIVSIIKQRFSKKINIKYEVNKNLISGFIIYIGDIIIDGSMHSNLLNFQSILQS